MESVPWFWVLALIPPLVALIGWRSWPAALVAYAYVTGLIWVRLGQVALIVWLLFCGWVVYRLMSIFVKMKATAFVGGAAR